MKPCSIVYIFLKEKYFGTRFLLLCFFLGSFVAALKIVVSCGNADVALGSTAAACVFSSVFEAARKAWVAAGCILPGKIIAFYKVKCVASSYWKAWGRTMNDSLSLIQRRTDPSCAWLWEYISTQISCSYCPSYVENAFATLLEDRMGCLCPAFSCFLFFLLCPFQCIVWLCSSPQGMSWGWAQITHHMGLEQLNHLTQGCNSLWLLWDLLRLCPKVSKLFRLSRYSD